MKHPFWILNSALLVLLIGAIGFIFFSYQSYPERESIEKRAKTKPIKSKVSKIAIEKIYENDLFDTYRASTPEAAIAGQSMLPPAPMPTPVLIPEEPKTQFLEPLAIELKGIMTFAVNETKNRAIIKEAKTGVEKMYKVGDSIDDAQLLRIYSTKILFIRSNGQQEILYLREKDALADPAYASIVGWKDVIMSISDTSFVIDPDAFALRISNLAQFLDMLDVTTVYKKGESFGLRIGTLEDNSIGVALGLQKGDIIMSVNDIPATTTAARFKIYKTVVSADAGFNIEAKILRNGRELLFDYTIAKSQKETKESAAKSQERREQEQQELFAKKHTLAPTMQDIRIKERYYMKDQGRRPIAPLSKPIE